MKAILAVTILTAFVTFVHNSEAVTCPPENEELVTLIPNPLDCTTFYICNGGTPYLMKCSPGLLFNPVEKVCDWPAHAGCKPHSETTTLPPTSEPEWTTTPEPEWTTTSEPEWTTTPEPE
ncbi:peritrophin-1-like, partial [Hylaeus anthracinus]|uniref:peritrophin-1-like n=1 Tax=Hylaeus anthracinus TaxID=313031 RepID=UPI0023B9B7AA